MHGGKSAGSVTMQDVENGMLVFGAGAGKFDIDINNKNICPTITVGSRNAGYRLATIGFNAKSSASQSCNPSEVMPTLDVAKNGGHSIIDECYVRRLTPIECERLQGFPDDYTRIPYRGKPAENCLDGPRYKVLGNSQAVPVQRWIGERIMMMDEILKQQNQ